ncbi:MAG: YabP/YqfC family sporulation protein [Oscillospiraceae bacterium]|nr:YabP/YqfC family sporulation protein [Oscillospiraceae bacterium]
MRKKRAAPRQEPGEKANAVTAPERLAQMLDVPQNVFTAFSQICLSGNREAVLDGCQGVLEYEPELIRLNLGDMILQFTGRNLQIKCMTGENVIIEGYILTVSFST